MAAVSGHTFNIGPYRKNNEKSSYLKLLGQLGPKFIGMVLGWFPFRIISVGPEVNPRWLTSAGHSFNIGPYGKNNEKSSCLKLLDQ